MGIKNPIESIVGILALLDEVRLKMKGTGLAEIPWRPRLPDSADELAGLCHEPFERCDDVTEAVIVVAVAATIVAQRETALIN